MTIAKVTLVNGPASHTRKGRVFVKGIPQTITSPSEIDYYKGEYGFSVAIQGGANSKKTKDKQKKKVYTYESLSKKKKEKLLTIAKKRKVLLTGKESKDEVVHAILDGQEGE